MAKKDEAVTKPAETRQNKNPQNEKDVLQPADPEPKKHEYQDQSPTGGSPAPEPKASPGFESAQAEAPKTTTVNNESGANPAPSAPPVALSQEQLTQLIAALTAGGTVTTDHKHGPSMTPGVGMHNPTAQGAGLRTNAQGQLIGTEVRWNIDPDYYPNPIDKLLDEFDTDPRMRRFNMRENYFITWDIDSKPYDTKYGVPVQEPFFHVTLYMNLYDDEGYEVNRAVLVQTLHFNEDQQIALQLAAENGWNVTEDNVREVMDQARYERVKQWLLGIFFPEKNFQPSEDAKEEAIGGQVVKVVTKSNVKGFGNPTPKIKDEELQ